MNSDGLGSYYGADGNYDYENADDSDEGASTVDSLGTIVGLAVAGAVGLGILIKDLFKRK